MSEPICIRTDLPRDQCGHCRQSPDYETLPSIGLAAIPREPKVPDETHTYRRERAFTPCICSGCGNKIRAGKEMAVDEDRDPFCLPCMGGLL